MSGSKSGQSTQLHSATSTWRRDATTQGAAQPVAIASAAREKQEILEDAVSLFYRLRQEGQFITASQFCQRYPSYRKSLRRRLDVQEEIDDLDLDDLDDEDWPEPICEFLGFYILHELGSGAIARVYLASEIELSRYVALKVSLHGGDEAKTLAKLTHRNIVPVYSVQQDEATGMTAICMPYHGSATLSDLLDVAFESGKPPLSASIILDAARQREQIADFVDSLKDRSQADKVLRRGSYVDGVAHLGLQMAQALEYTHEHQILHRDLKPSNVLLTPDGIPMLLDFNLATDLQAQGPRLGGTLPYMPPEQIRAVHMRPFEGDQSRDPRADIFSLGVILYELLAGRLPFGDPPISATPKHAAEAYLEAQLQPITPLPELNPQVSPMLAKAIERCLAWDVEQRPATANELAALLQQQFSLRTSLFRWVHQHVAALAAACLLLLGTVSFLGWHLATRPPYAERQHQAGLADLLQNQPMQAIEHFDRALLANPDAYDTLFARGVTQQNLGKHEKAYSDLDRAAKGLEDDVLRECLAFSAAHVSRDNSASRSIYGELSQKNPDDPSLLLNLAYSYWVNGKTEPALSCANKVLTLEGGGSFAAHYLLALLYSEQAQGSQGREKSGDFESAVAKAKRHIDGALELTSREDARLVYNACLIHALGRSATANPRLQELIQAASRAGVAPEQLRNLGHNQSWRADPWFREAISASSGSAEFGPIEAHFLSPPDPHRVRQRLMATEVTD